MTTCFLVPVGKPRMTRRDKFVKRPAIVKYRIFADALRDCMKDVDLSDVWCMTCKCWLPFPPSYSFKKREKLKGKIHRVKPDASNILKGIEDSLVEHDECIAGVLLWKYWDDGYGPRIEITVNEEPE